MHIRLHALFMGSPAERLAPACSTYYNIFNIVRAYNATYDDDDDDDDRKYKGRHKERGWTTQKTTADNLAKLRVLAGDRQKWRDIVIDICDAEGA